jgi:hypothetical protein
MECAAVPYTTATPAVIVLTAQQFSADRWHPPALGSVQHSAVESVQPQFLLLEAPAPGWRLLEPIPLTLEVDLSLGEPQVIAYDSLVNVYGAGRTAWEAISEYKSMLLDLYQELEQSQARLSLALQQRWRQLRLLVARA